MGKGCLVLSAAFGAALFLELRQARAMELPHPWIVAAALAILATLVVGSVQGLVEARKRRANPESAPDQWRDGELVRLGGRLRAAGPLLTAPFSGRQAVCYQYWAREVRAKSESVDRIASFRGMDQTPLELETSHGRIRLKGFPRMRAFLPKSFDSDANREAAARLLAQSTFQMAPSIWSADLADGEATFANEDGRLPAHLMNQRAAEVLELAGARHPAEHCRDRLATRHWVYQERAVGEGEEVTVLGTYRAADRSLDIASSVSGSEHEMLPGGAAQTAAQNLTTTIVFALILALLAGVAHWAAYSDDGAVYKGVLEKLGLAG